MSDQRDANHCCIGCVHWLPGRVEGSPDIGTCKRYPPTVDAATGNQALPATGARDWCGEFKRLRPL